MSRKLLAGTVLLSAGVLVAVFTLSAPKPLYARSVSEFLAHPIRDQPVRVTGTLVHGSLSHSSGEPCEYNFRLTGNWSPRTDAGTLATRPELSVRYAQCYIPDTFRDLSGTDVEVSVEGEMCANCHRFEASQVLVKCPGVYRIAPSGSACGPHWPAK